MNEWSNDNEIGKIGAMIRNEEIQRVTHRRRDAKRNCKKKGEREKREKRGERRQCRRKLEEAWALGR